jgi:hypothetical protein
MATNPIKGLAVSGVTNCHPACPGLAPEESWACGRPKAMKNGICSTLATGIRDSVGQCRELLSMETPPFPLSSRELVTLLDFSRF